MSTGWWIEWAGERTWHTSTICAHVGVVVSVAKSTTCQRCTRSAAGAATSELAAPLTLDHVRALRPDLDRYVTRVELYITVKVRQHGVDGRVGEMYRKTDLTQNDT